METHICGKSSTSKFHRQTQQNFGKRPTNVVPVGAWVEQYPKSHDIEYTAIFAARHEEERLERLQAEKEAKLARFRKEVKARVRELHRIKHQQQLQQSYQAVDLQGRVMHRTTHSANQLSHRKDKCVYKSSDPHAIGHPTHPGFPSSDPLATTTGDGSGGEATRQQLIEQATQTRRLVQKAKRDLAAKQLMFKGKGDGGGVPGGFWGQSYTRDKPASVVETEKIYEADHGLDMDHPKATIAASTSHHVPQEPVEEAIYSDTSNNLPDREDAFATEKLYEEAGIERPKRVTFVPGLTGSPQLPGKVLGSGGGDYVQGVSAEDEELGRTFQRLSTGPMPMEGQGEDGVKVDPSVCERLKVHGVAEVNPGIVAEEHRKQLGVQFSMYRRLYMDIEREQVREKQRKRTHHRKIQQLKREKEQERLEVERRAQLMTEPTHFIGESEAKAKERENAEAEEIKKIQRQLRQKNKETKRFIRALRAVMRERITLLGVTPPPLCACGPTVWDANPDTCANNCVFYKNPKAYAKALASVLSLTDTN
ncbi:uncharacterized protein [Diadema antillarum]|uniref:uncharacterized protein n=1 Tax=Diadema antillarum TaxID=105358 RepID=UPI003A8437B9